MVNKEMSKKMLVFMCAMIAILATYTLSFADTEISEDGQVEELAYVGYDMKTTVSGKCINVLGYSQFWVHEVEINPDKGQVKSHKGEQGKKVGTFSYDRNSFTTFANGTSYGFVGANRQNLEQIHYIENGKVRGTQGNI